ncbi:MAG: hypothetical protein QM715_03780 [Nibricoccus sp.]
MNESGSIKNETKWSWMWFPAVCVLLVLFKLWLVSAQTVLAVGHASHDDALFINLARHILGGRWLGPYNELTLAKGPMYSLFIAGSFLLGIPLFTAQHLLYIAACGFLTRAFRLLVPNRWFLLGLFAVLLFNPVTYDASTHSRVLRQDILHSLVLMILAGLVGLYACREQPKKRLLPWILLLGISLPAFWLTREEGVWLMPCVILVWAFTAFAIWRQKPADLTARIALLIVPAVMWLSGLAIVAGLNKAYYGVFTTCEFRQSEFKSAFGAMLRTAPKDYPLYLPVTREGREKLYTISPTFAKLRAHLEGPTGEAWAGIGEFVTHKPPAEREIAMGWLMWALRRAVVETGQAKNAAETMAFYKKMADEINTACDRGLIPARAKMGGFIPPIEKQQRDAFITVLPKTAKYFVSFGDITPVTNGGSSGTAEELVWFTDLTRGRLSPGPGVPAIPRRQARLDQLRVSILSWITDVYAALTPWIVVLGLLTLTASSVLILAKRSFNFHFLLSLGLIGSNAATIIIVSLIDATSFPALNTGYFTGGYALWMLFIFVSSTSLQTVLTKPSLSTIQPLASKP